MAAFTCCGRACACACVRAYWHAFMRKLACKCARIMRLCGCKLVRHVCCACACVRACVHACVRVCVCARMGACIHACLGVRVRAYVCRCILWSGVHVRVRVCVCVCACTPVSEGLPPSCLLLGVPVPHPLGKPRWPQVLMPSAYSECVSCAPPATPLFCSCACPPANELVPGSHCLLPGRVCGGQRGGALAAAAGRCGLAQGPAGAGERFAHAHARARTHAFMHESMHRCTHARTHAHKHANTHAYKHANTHTHTRTHAPSHAHTHVRTHAVCVARPCTRTHARASCAGKRAPSAAGQQGVGTGEVISRDAAAGATSGSTEP